MPYTLTSLGRYLAYHRHQRPIAVSSALVSSAPYRPDEPVARWSRSLEGLHPQLHAEGKHAVALISDDHLLAVMPFSWAERLPLRKPRPLTLTVPLAAARDSSEPPKELYSINPLPLLDDGFIEEPLHTAAKPAERGVDLIEKMRKLYVAAEQQLMWWEDNYATDDVRDYQVRVDVGGRLRQVRLSERRNRTQYLRRVAVSGVNYRARRDSRHYYSDNNVVWVQEDVFQVFAQDAVDFNRRFVLLSLFTGPTLAIVERRSHLILGILQATPDYVADYLTIK